MVFSQEPEAGPAGKMVERMAQLLGVDQVELWTRCKRPVLMRCLMASKL
jgi:hypothetical protein